MTGETLETWLLRSMEPGMRYTAHSLADLGDPYDEADRPETDPDTGEFSSHAIKDALGRLSKRGLVRVKNREVWLGPPTAAHGPGRNHYFLTPAGAQAHDRLVQAAAAHEALHAG